MSWGDSELNFKAKYVLKSSLGRIKIIMPSQFPRNVQKKAKVDFFLKPSHKIFFTDFKILT